MLDQGVERSSIQQREQRNRSGVQQTVSELTADVISRTAFGSSYKEGKEAFHAQKQLLSLDHCHGNSPQCATARIQSRLTSKVSEYGDELPGAMLETCFTTEHGEKRDELVLTMDEIIDECKTFFFAGNDNTSHLLTWTMFLLSVYPEWQERLREEVLRECGKKNPTAEMLRRLKVMTMVLLELLRLYGPGIFMIRKPISDIRLGSLIIPKGNGIVIPIPMLHRDKEVWGDNANEFDPLRFEDGATKAAKIPQAFIAFSLGPRSCIGRNFAMLEAKSVMAMILQKFSFALSPTSDGEGFATAEIGTTEMIEQVEKQRTSTL
ncbi:hypothetical protein PR202_gn00122 [Eleusine coracana subsp. coracana]|uniref:Uncharacterized protein n=1 Tax=Eleusine coracana subsp. coracana TaxID=191504 RepID=A0AAV5F9L2_ELECO|nr:hypothetical protein PR202_gb20011 [Eleusine coracana subsp. coracana]GJN40818.1 hypothetical protein PR202_gn00122 [Eleusine coracana subsp. coracana]